MQACNACFKCQVPEFRFVWLMISLTFGCVFDAQKMSGQMEHHCLAEGVYYTDVLCGPRGHFFATPADFAAATRCPSAEFAGRRSRATAESFDSANAAGALPERRRASYRATVTARRVSRPPAAGT